MAELASIKHYNYENVDLREKAEWLAGAPGASGDPLPAKLRLIATTFSGSHARLTADIEALGAAWTGHAADAAQDSLRTAAHRATTAAGANDEGHAAVAGYAESFEQLRSKVHFEDPYAAWRPGVPADPFTVQEDHFAVVQRHRTADAAANAALRAHEERTRQLVDEFPTLTATTAPAGGPPAAPQGGGGSGAWAGGLPVVPDPGGPGAGAVPSVRPATDPGPGPATTPSTGARPGAAPPPTPTTPALPPPSAADVPRALGAPRPGAAPAGSGPAPRRSGPTLPALPPPAAAPPGVTDGLIGARRNPSVFAPDGRRFAGKLPAVPEPPTPAGRPGSPVAASPSGAPARPGTTAIPPIMGGGAAGAATTHRTKYWTPSSAPFDVELPPHVDGVIGADPDGR